MEKIIDFKKMLEQYIHLINNEIEEYREYIEDYKKRISELEDGLIKMIEGKAKALETLENLKDKESNHAK